MSAPRHRNHTSRNYMLIFCIPILVAITIIGALHIFLWRVQETTGPVSAAQIQDQTSALYGPALVYRPYAYKLERYRLKSPDIVLVGSSRVMAFAGEVFTVPVLNAGGAANTFDQAVDFIHASIAIHKPKAILLGLDFWWFNPNRDDEIGATGEMSNKIDLSLTQLISPIQWIADGRLQITSFLKSLIPFNELGSGIGASAKFDRRGWDIYGRYDYGNLFYGETESDDQEFKRTLKRLQNAKKSSKLNIRVAPSVDTINELRELIAELEAQSIEVTLLLPPIANPVREVIEQDAENRLIPLWRSMITDLGVRVFDFTDPRTLKSSDCEFIDGFHGGEVTYLRILDAIARFDDSVIAQSIDHDMVSGLIAANSDHARILELLPNDAPPEIDFLDIGCSKTH